MIILFSLPAVGLEGQGPNSRQIKYLAGYFWKSFPQNSRNQAGKSEILLNVSLSGCDAWLSFSNELHFVHSKAEKLEELGTPTMLLSH